MKKSTLRQQAEEKLGKQKSTAIPTTEADTLRLVHELQVHQIELEMQNEELVQARAEAEAVHRQYADLYDFAPVGYFTLARDGTISKVNLAGATLLGMARNELLTRRFGLFVSPLSRAAFVTFLEKVFSADSKKQTCEVELLCRGKTESLWAQIEATCDDTYETCRAVVVDISERKQNQAKVNFQAGLLEAVGQAVIATDLAGTVIYFNPAAENLYGCPVAEALGRNILEINVPALSQTEAVEIMQQLHAGKTWSSEFLVQRQDGTVFPAHVSDSPVVNEAGQLIAIIGISSDITERKQAEEEIRQMNATLEQRVKERTAELVRANHIKDEFMANMSHELRTPLNGILGNAEILLEGVHGSINQKQSQSVETIYSSGQHLLNLINDILDVSKIESGKFELHPESISVQLICESSLTFIKQLALKKSIKVEYNPSPSASAIFADPIRLKQILVNLLSNAVKFTPENGNIKLEAWKDARSDQFEFSITDSGIGITPEDQQKLFKSFVQLDSGLARQHEGSGLGLALVRQLVEMHGGSVGVKSEPGKGSCFHFTIPARSTEIQAKNKLPAQLNPEETEAAQRNGTARILVVEDSATNMMITSEYLSAKGYQILEAHNGLEAIKYAHEQHLDLILMDIQMPGISGIETIKQLRAEPKFASLPIIALTALAMPGDRELCLEAGATEYLSKPVSLKKLIEVIGNLLNKQIPIE